MTNEIEKGKMEMIVQMKANGIGMDLLSRILRMTDISKEQWLEEG